MNGFDWNAIYLTCFGVGLVLSLLAFFGGFPHLHVGHLRIGGGHRIAGASHSHVSPVNGFTVVAFLCWFGGTGYLLHRANIFTASLVLLFSSLSGLAGSSLLGWFLMSVLLPSERTLESSDTEMTGVIGRLSGAIPKGGVGEILYSQNGARRSAPVRSDDGTPIERDAEVIVMRYARGVAYVRRWDEFEHGLLGSTSVAERQKENL
jgi:hypothetical protein